MKKQNPLPITSFVEDDFEFGARQQQKTEQQPKVSPELLHRLAIFGIRTTMTIAAFVLAFWLFSLINSLIESQQFRRFHTPVPVYSTLYNYYTGSSSLTT